MTGCLAHMYALSVLLSIRCSSLALTFDSGVFINGFVSGAVINAAKNLILHPIETVKTRLDVGEKEGILKDLYVGIGPSLAGGIPAAALFFGTKDVCKNCFLQIGFDANTATILSVTIAQLPYWMVRNPSEVIKTRLRTSSSSSSSSLNDILVSGDLKDLYSGFTSNLLYALPSDWLKFIFYDIFENTLFGVNQGELVNTGGAIICGSLAGLVSETICTPLDVARNRIMSNVTALSNSQVTG